MTDRNDYVDKCLDPRKRDFDRNRGLQLDGFADALNRAAANQEKEVAEDRPIKDSKENLS